MASEAADTRRRNVGIACVVASSVAFGAMAILARFAFASGIDTATLLALRFAIGSAIMIIARPWPRGSARFDALAGCARRSATAGGDDPISPRSTSPRAYAAALLLIR
jgi:drug/metabolite transporter (DMT)-like permease